MKASVKVMNSYDYCHFEITLSSDQEMTTGEVNEMRKDAQRLVDNAIDQYKIAKRVESRRVRLHSEYLQMNREVQIIKQNYPKSEWTPEQKAKVKALEDHVYLTYRYDYEDDFFVGD